MIGSRMSAGSLLSWREAAGPDWDAEYDEPTMRDRCTCGAFLPHAANDEVTQQEATKEEWRETEPDEDGVRWPYPVVVEWDEWKEPGYRCKRCGKVWAESEMWED